MKTYFYLWVFLWTASLACAGIEEWKLQNWVPDKAGKMVKTSGEFRYRLEGRDNFDFDDAKDDEDVFHLFRTRLNIGIEPLEFARALVQFQDARIADSEFANEAPFKDPFDLRQGYLELYSFSRKGLGLRIGRQELAYGAERLIGAFNWSNVAQSFDAAKVFYQFENSRIDVFAARKVVIDSSTIFNEWDDRDQLAGLYGSCQALQNHTIDAYYFFRDTDKPVVFGPNAGSGDLGESTIGGRVAGKQPWGLDYQLEGAYQFGDFGEMDISAWMVIAMAGYTFDFPGSPRFGLEVNHGSGDESSSDGERNTFDNLFPTNHLFYGYMDLASLQNITDYIISASVKPLSRLTAKLDMHFLFLDETSDSLYNAARVPIRTATADVDDEIGTELDLTLNYQICSGAAALLGYSHFFPGDFISQTGKSDDGDFFYLQLAVSF